MSMRVLLLLLLLLLYLSGGCSVERLHWLDQQSSLVAITLSAASRTTTPLRRLA